jgi:hypothetical protein
MNSFRLAAAALVLGLTLPLPVAAQESPVDPGDYIEVSMIKVDDGHGLEYAKYLAGNWRKSQDYSVQQGWISSYEIWTNVYGRDGEADIWLITHVPNLPDAAETERRDRAYEAYMQQTIAEQEASSGQRAEFRHLAGSLLMREQVWAK